MLQSDATLTTSREGSTVRLHDITPAEALLLVVMNHSNIGKQPLSNLTNKRNVPKMETVKIGKEETIQQGLSKDGWKTALYEEVDTEKEVERTDAQELNRLRGKYRADHIKQLYPGASPTLPKTFEEAMNFGLSVEELGDKMLNGRLASMQFP